MSRVGWQLRRSHDGFVLCTDGEWRDPTLAMMTPSRLYKSPAGAAAKQRSLEFNTELERVER